MKKSNGKRLLVGLLAATMLIQTPLQAAAETVSAEVTAEVTSETETEAYATTESDSGSTESTVSTESTISTESTEASQSTESTESTESQYVPTTEIKAEITVNEDANDDGVVVKKNDKPFLALGENLTADQQQTVLSLMGVDPASLSEYDVLYVTNEEEHTYLGTYIDASKIGTKSLSSVVIVERKDGNGLKISTKNINYCTIGMYKNALATAGINNADIIVAAPFPISGTAALVGIFKTYKEITGEEIPQENVDAAIQEIVITGALESSVNASPEEIEGMIAYIKEQIVAGELTDEASIQQVIEEAMEEFNVSLTEEQISEITDLMTKIGALDLNVDDLKDAAQSVYDKISELTGNTNLWDQIVEFLSGLFEKLKGML
ncbi:MAG: DUF1002 domain-containing protein [Lachnospiraceae bacterium]